MFTAKALILRLMEISREEIVKPSEPLAPVYRHAAQAAAEKLAALEGIDADDVWLRAKGKK